MERNKSKIGYIPELDGMRGIAVLAVMAFHSQIQYFRGGFIGVDIFFGLSGFLITTLIIREYDKFNSVNLKCFYMRRVLRLAPALVLLLLAVVPISFIFLNEERIFYNATDVLITLLYLSNWAHALNIHPPELLSHTWTLSIEEQFYILWPITLLFLLKFIQSRWHVVMITLFIALSSWLLRIILLYSGSSVTRVYAGLDTRVDTLLFGCILAIILSPSLISENRQQQFALAINYVASLSALVIILLFTLLNWKNPAMYYWIYFVVEILVVTIVFAIVISKKNILNILLKSKPLVWVGSISYGLYLWHYPIYRVMFTLDFSNIEVIVFGTLCTFIVASTSYYFLERPFLRLKKRWASSNT